MDNLIKFLAKEYNRSGNYRFQTFYERNLVNDPMIVVYDDGRIRVEHCENYGYIEIFGLTEEEKEVLRKMGWNEG